VTAEKLSRAFFNLECPKTGPATEHHRSLIAIGRRRLAKPALAAQKCGMVNETTPQKMLRILDLIEEAEAPMPAEDIGAALGFTRSTLYRHLKSLGEAGLISSLPGRGFSLGPRVAELDYRMRLRDPLIGLARPVMATLAAGEQGVALLCRRYRDGVLCLHQEDGGAAFRSNYDRGLARSLIKGAASRIILAQSNAAQVARLFALYQDEFAASGLGADMATVKASLRLMRVRGWDMTQGQVTAGVTGVAVPIFDAERALLGCLSVTLGTTALETCALARVIERLKAGAAAIQSGLVPGAAN
jgi:DNA-binding IclR family transcriptional regulator